MKTVSKKELEQLINDQEKIILINVLPKTYFDKLNIPNSINIPFKDNTNFISEVEERVMSKEARIILYCSNIHCTLSKEAAQKLENAGFSNIDVFEEGVEGWFTQDQDAA